MSENKLTIATDGEEAMVREEFIASMGPRTKKIHDKIEKIMLDEARVTVKNRWKIGLHVISLQELAKDKGEPSAVEKVAGALGVSSQLRHFKRIVEAFPTEEDIDAVCDLRDAANRPIGYSKLFLLCAQDIKPRERRKLLTQCKDPEMTVVKLRSEISGLLTQPGRKNASGKEYKMSEGGRKAKPGTTVPPRSLIAAGRKLSTMCFKILEARDGFNEVYDKYFEDQPDLQMGVDRIEIFETLDEQLQDVSKMINELTNCNHEVLSQMREELEKQQEADRTLDVPAKPQKAKRQKLEVSENRQKAISRAKAQAEEGAAPF